MAFRDSGFGGITRDDAGKCACMSCCKISREAEGPINFIDSLTKTFRYACELCGNKRCPHHTDHTLECTRSNKPGQKGSWYI